MTYMVGVDAKDACSDVELLVFREAKGIEVGRKRFNSQYEGKTVSDPIRINKDITNITGATMSVRPISAGVKRVLVLVDEFYLKPAGQHQKEKQCIQQPNVAIRIPQFEFLIEVSHVGTRGPLRLVP